MRITSELILIGLSRKRRINSISNLYSAVIAAALLELEDLMSELIAAGAVERREEERRLLKNLGPIEKSDADPAAVDRIVQRLRAELLEPGPLDDETIILASLLQKADLLNDYFSKYERDELKARLKAMHADPVYEQIMQVVDEVETYFTVIYTVFIAVL